MRRRLYAPRLPAAGLGRGRGLWSRRHFDGRPAGGQGWFIIAYALGIYLLNLLIAFLSPRIDPALAEMDNGAAWARPGRGRGPFPWRSWRMELLRGVGRRGRGWQCAAVAGVG